MILTRNKRDQYRLNVTKGVYTRICKEVQERCKVPLEIASADEYIVSTGIVKGEADNVYILNIYLYNNTVTALLIDCRSKVVRHTVGLETYRIDINGDAMECTEERVNEYIGKFIAEVALLCK